MSKQRHERPARSVLNDLNGSHTHIWDMLWYLSDRVDGVFKLIIGFGTGIIVAVVATWVSLMAQL